MDEVDERVEERGEAPGRGGEDGEVDSSSRAPGFQDEGEEGLPGEVRRPLPVRKAMEGPDQPEDGGEDARVFRDPEGDDAWQVTVTGQAVGGVLPLRTVPLLELAFVPVRDPGARPRRVLCQGRSLADLRDDELLVLLRSAAEAAPQGGGTKGKQA